MITVLNYVFRELYWKQKKLLVCGLHTQVFYWWRGKITLKTFYKEVLEGPFCSVRLEQKNTQFLNKDEMYKIFFRFDLGKFRFSFSTCPPPPYSPQSAPNSLDTDDKSFNKKNPSQPETMRATNLRKENERKKLKMSHF